MTTLTVAIYGLFGTLAVAAGLITLVALAVILADSDMTGLTAHLVREESAQREILSPVINSLPVLLLAVTAPLARH